MFEKQALLNPKVLRLLPPGNTKLRSSETEIPFKSEDTILRDASVKFCATLLKFVKKFSKALTCGSLELSMGASGFYIIARRERKRCFS